MPGTGVGIGAPVIRASGGLPLQWRSYVREQNDLGSDLIASGHLKRRIQPTSYIWVKSLPLCGILPV